jgi:pimeloyl-ACP methyl ester carboxylesterase
MAAAAEQFVLTTADGERLAARHLPLVPGRDSGGGPTGDAAGELAVVLAHGFTGSFRRPAVRAVAERLSRFAGVLAFDFRGHGGSTGVSTLGDREVFDVDAAVAAARGLGYRQVVTCGFSMGASAVLRHAALYRGVDAVVAVSGLSRWYYRDTAPMRRVQWVAEHRLGRLVARRLLDTRIDPLGWNPPPEAPLEVVGRISPTPLLIVHGERDHYFPTEHAEALAAAAGAPVELWLVPDFGHAESGATPELLDRIGRVLTDLVGRTVGGAA